MFMAFFCGIPPTGLTLLDRTVGSRVCRKGYHRSFWHLVPDEVFWVDLHLATSIPVNLPRSMKNSGIGQHFTRYCVRLTNCEIVWWWTMHIASTERKLKKPCESKKHRRCLFYDARHIAIFFFFISSFCLANFACNYCLPRFAGP